MPRVGVVAERLRSRLWPIPALAACLAAVLAGGLSTARSQRAGGPVWWPGEPASARGLLEVLAGSSLTVVALVFSLQVVALQLAASQYSPRLLRTYARDLVIQVSLAVLIATFVFSLVTLALFGTADRPPRVSVAVAVVLGLGSVAALVGVVAHIVSSLRVETMMAELHADASAVISQVYGDDDDRRATASAADLHGGQRHPFHARQAGFVQAVDDDSIVRWAASHGLLVDLDVSPGEHVLAGTVLGCAYGATEADVQDDLASTVLIGHERTPDEDPGFGLLQLVDICLRALSPGVNDPTTALHAIGHLTSLLVEMSALRTDRYVVRQGIQGEPRLIRPRPTLGDHLAATCRPVIRAGAGHPEVLLATARLLDEVARVDPGGVPPAVQRVAVYLERAARRGLADERDLTEVLDAVAAVT